MNKLFYTALSTLLISTNAFALSTINYTTQTRWGSEAYKVHSNFVEINANKSLKTDSVLLYTAWPIGTTFTTASPGVWSNGKLYKCIASYTKLNTTAPDSLPLYFSEVAGPSSGSGSTLASGIVVTPNEDIASITVQAALYELGSEKLNKDSDLLAIAALSTTTFGRSLLEASNATIAKAALELEAPLPTPSSNGMVLKGDKDRSFYWDTISIPTSSGIEAPTTNGIVTYNGGGVFGASLTAGTGANNIVQLNASSQLPAISGVNLTTLPSWVATDTELATAIATVETSTVPDGTISGDGLRWNGTAWVAGSFSINLNSLGDLQYQGANLVDDTATNGHTTKVWSADKVYDMVTTKQDTLISGSNLKTINGATLLGSGNISITGSGGGVLDTLSSPPYSDVACTNSGYYSGYVYHCVNGFFTQRTTASTYSNPSPAGSDNFNRADGSLGASWSSASNVITNLSIVSNRATSSGDWVVGAGRFISNTNDTSQAVLIGNTPSGTSSGNVCVRMNETSDGYCGRLADISGGNYTTVGISKEGSWLCDVSALSYSAASNHTIKITASGTNPVIVDFYVDGTKVTSTCQDTSSTLSTGNPGIKISADGSTRPTLDDWQAY